MIYELQPQILVNDRLGVPADLDTPEQHVTASAPGRGWESCMTIADPESWGWSRHAPNRKTVPELLKNLSLAASGEGNYLLNIGPMPDGSVDPLDAEPLRAIGEWLKVHGEAIYGSQRYFPDYTRHWQGVYTRKGKTVYIILFRYSSEVPVPLLEPFPVKATLLSYGSGLSIHPGYNRGFVVKGLPDEPPVPVQPVIKLEFDETPRRVMESDHAAWIEGNVQD
jgi:alpha-L-fucosidase